MRRAGALSSGRLRVDDARLARARAAGGQPPDDASYAGDLGLALQGALKASSDAMSTPSRDDEIEQLEAANEALRKRIARVQALAGTSRPLWEGLRRGLLTTLIVVLALGALGGLFLFLLLRTFRMPGG